MTVIQASRFNEILVITDDQSWIWSFVGESLEALKTPYVRLPSTVPIRQSWERFKNSHRMIIHWESKNRNGGAIIEEILEIAPHFNVADRIIVLTTNPTHEDVVYFSELGLKRIMRLRHRDQDLLKSREEFFGHFKNAPEKDQYELAWRAIQQAIDSLPHENIPPETLAKIDSKVEMLGAGPNGRGARYLDSKGSIALARGQNADALSFWQGALDKNPNYFRSYKNLINYHRKLGNRHEAYGLMQKMQTLNRSNIQRLVGMGEIQVELNDEMKAEHYFRVALSFDPFASGALNGLAEIRFRQGDLDESRRLLSRSQLAYQTAARLNLMGIDMVRKGQFEKALTHYTKAQYVLPQQDKGPLLFYNIGLCYYRWGKPSMAMQFLQIALIKEPRFKKAEKLLEEINRQLGINAA